MLIIPNSNFFSPLSLYQSRDITLPTKVHLVKATDEGEDHRQEADEQRRHQQRQEAPVALHGHQRPILRAVAGKELGEAAAPGYWPAARRGVDF